MAYIAIQGVTRQWGLGKIRSHLQPDLPCDLKALYFMFENKLKKTAYLQVMSDKYDPTYIVRLINKLPLTRQMKWKAIVPTYVSQAHIASKGKPKKKKAGAKNKHSADAISGSDEVLITTHREIMGELQSKFTKLYNLSRKSPDNKLLENIARTIFERLKNIMETDPELAQSCFKLSSHYRKLHPHFGDFQMILSTLHKVQDEHGAPRSELVETDLMNVKTQLNLLDNIPYDKIRSVSEKYSVRITKKILEHVRQLDSEATPTDTPEEATRKKVRLELKNMSMHLPSIIQQVIRRQLTPEKAPFHRVRIFGEPFLPSKDQMTPLTRRFKAVHIKRSDRIFNLIKMNIPPALYSSLMALDGTTIGNAKLVIRSSDMPFYKTPDSLIAEMKAYCGVGRDPSQEYDGEDE